MAESQALSGATDAIEYLLETGAENLYQKYLNGKVKAHSARTCRAQVENMFSYICMTKDKEPTGAKFAELWEDDGEPAAAKRPEWMTYNIRVKHRPPPKPEPVVLKKKKSLKRKKSRIYSPSKRVFSFSLTNAVAIERGDGIISI